MSQFVALTNDDLRAIRIQLSMRRTCSYCGRGFETVEEAEQAVTFTPFIPGVPEQPMTHKECAQPYLDRVGEG